MKIFVCLHETIAIRIHIMHVIALLFYYRQENMIINKAVIAQPENPFLRVTQTPKKNCAQVQSPQIVNHESQADDLHFDDSHFNTHFRVQNKQKEKHTQTTPTVIRKVSHVQMHLSKKDSGNKAISFEAGQVIRQGLINFLNYPIESAAFTPEINYSEGNYQRNYTSCSFRRKSSTVLSTYQSRRQLPATPERQEATKRGRCQKGNSFTHQEHLHKRKDHIDTNTNQRRFNSIDYSIIKPHQIQPAPISSRHRHKVKDFDGNFSPDLLATLRKKEELLQKHRQLQMERQKIRMRVRRQSSNRSNIHTSFLNRRTIARVEERNEVLPWEVDSNLTDII